MATALLRLKRREDFLRVAASRRRWVTPAFILQARERRESADGPAASARTSGSSPPGSTTPGTSSPGLSSEVRVGFTVSRKVGNAVVRNRVRRRLRAAVAEVLPSAATPGFDLVLVGRAAALKHPYRRLVEDLATALSKVRATPRAGARP